MEYVLIDPQMFELSDEKDVNANIDFFSKMIALSRSGDILVCLYKEIMESIQNRQLYPFPLDISRIENAELKEKLLILNDSFSRAIINNYVPIDIDSCSGAQEYVIDRKSARDDYYEFFSMLLSSCYSSIQISSKILVGNKTVGILQGEHVTLSCKCDNKTYENTYTWVHPDDFLSSSQKALEVLRGLIKKDTFVENPETIKAHHHNHIQEKDFKYYGELSVKNKRVLSYLRYLGLYKIYFTRFEEDKSRPTGTIRIVNVEKGHNSDIVIGWLFGCVEYRILVELYFPQGIGDLLWEYSGGELTRDKMEQLKTELAL